jgi:hypothetical protein
MTTHFTKYKKRENWSFYKDAEYGQRVYIHRDGYKIISSGGTFRYLNGAVKGWRWRGRLESAMKSCERYGLVGYDEPAEKELREALGALSLEALEITKTLVIQDGVKLAEAMPMARALCLD